MLSVLPPPSRIPPPIIPKGILPGGQVHLLSGASGVGKSALLYQLVAAAIRGEKWMGLDIRTPQFVGMITSDRRGSDHQEWLETLNIHTDVPVYSLVDDHSLSGLKLSRGFFGKDKVRTRTARFELFCQSMDKLVARAELEVIPWDSLIILDPISLFMGGNLLDYNSVYTHMFDLSQWCVRHGATIIGLCHAGKQRGDPKVRYSRPQDRVLGSTAQTGCAGTTLHLAPPTETMEMWSEVIWVPHHAPAGLVRIVRDDKGLFVEASAAEVSSADMAALKLLVLFPPDGQAMATKSILRQAEVVLNLKRTQTMKHMQTLTENGFIEPVKRGVFRRRKAKEA